MNTDLMTMKNYSLVEKMDLSVNQLKSCQLCEHRCKVDRTKGETGFCQATDSVNIYSEFIHYGIEYDLIPAYAIFFSGCSLRCAFCSSRHGLDPDFGIPLNPKSVARRIDEAEQKGAKTVLFVGGEPSIHPHAIIEIAEYRKSSIPLVLDTNLYGTEEIFYIFDGLINIYLADFKFGNDQCAQRIAGIPRYSQTLKNNLVLADEHGELIIRHILLPGHLDCCYRPIADWISQNLPNVRFNLSPTYEPVYLWRKNDLLDRKINDEELNQARQYARNLHLRLIE